MSTRLELLCDALRANGAAITVASRTAMRVRGAGIQALADEIRYHKPELLRGLYGHSGAAPFACAGCGAEVVLAADFTCTWCSAKPPGELEILPGSSAEVAYLARVIHTEKSSQFSQSSHGSFLGEFAKNPPTART
jgi:hypothetical protein